MQTRTERGAARPWAILILGVLAGLAAAWMFASVAERKIEAATPWVRVVEVTEDSDDPADWGRNWPHQYDRYLRTAEATETRYGGSSLGLSDGLAEQKLDVQPWLKRMFAGYAFAIDYRDRRGHAHMLDDQQATKRVTERKQPGACLQCHTSVVRLYDSVGHGNSRAGFEAVCGMDYAAASALVDDAGVPLVRHPIGCLDCHDPQTMAPRVTRPAFIEGIAALKAHEGLPDYDVNRDATRQELRSYVCAQCHNEYSFQGPGKLVTQPWGKGLKVEEIEAWYDERAYSDWTHAETGAQVLKAQHPEFEVWSQGIHARAGVSCADCHMPYERVGAAKLSDHWVRSPLLNVGRACLPCHGGTEAEMVERVHAVQDRHFALLERAGGVLSEMLDSVAAAKAAGATDADLAETFTLQRKAQWRLDFVAAENSMGFHAPQELARVLAESIDYARQAQLRVQPQR